MKRDEPGVDTRMKYRKGERLKDIDTVVRTFEIGIAQGKEGSDIASESGEW